MSSTKIKILLSVFVIVGASAYVLGDTLFAEDAEHLTYFHNADVVLAEAQAMTGKRIRMGGHVEKGSIFQKKGTLEYQFDVRPVLAMVTHQDVAEKTLTVRYKGTVPDTFKDDAEVIVGGALGTDGVFEAKELIAKCPSKYEAAEKQAGTY